MNLAAKIAMPATDMQKIVQDLYLRYGEKLLAYTRKNYNIDLDDAQTIVYKTIYRIASVIERYEFSVQQQRDAFVLKTHLNYLRNYFRDNRSFEYRNFEVQMLDTAAESESGVSVSDPKLQVLQNLLDTLDDWQRVLLLMRSQGVSYREISKFVDKPQRQLKVYYARLKKQMLEAMNKALTTTKK